MAAFPNTRALLKKREKLEALIEAAIDCLDSLDGDPEAESSVGFDTPEWDDGENDCDIHSDDELNSYITYKVRFLPKVISTRQAAAIRRRVEAQLAFIQHHRVA